MIYSTVLGCSLDQYSCYPSFLLANLHCLPFSFSLKAFTCQHTGHWLSMSNENMGVQECDGTSKASFGLSSLIYDQTCRKRASCELGRVDSRSFGWKENECASFPGSLPDS